jgi:hypothetical protein
LTGNPHRNPYSVGVYHDSYFSTCSRRVAIIRVAVVGTAVDTGSGGIWHEPPSG